MGQILTDGLVTEQNLCVPARSVPSTRPHRLKPAPSKAAISPRERRRQRRLAEILEARFEEFAQRSYAATRLEDVGERVSLTKGAIYLYFKDKEEVFKAVVRSVIHPALQQLFEVAP